MVFSLSLGTSVQSSEAPQQVCQNLTGPSASLPFLEISWSECFCLTSFLDIVAASDTVWHSDLLYKLVRSGVQGRMFCWIRTFLSDREFRVVFATSTRHGFPFGAGVPQGSLL